MGEQTILLAVAQIRKRNFYSSFFILNSSFYQGAFIS